jgi:hypothetical protein
VNRAISDGYVQFGGCVSSPEVGAVGVHFVNGSLVARSKSNVPRR